MDKLTDNMIDTLESLSRLGNPFEVLDHNSTTKSINRLMDGRKKHKSKHKSVEKCGIFRKMVVM